MSTVATSPERLRDDLVRLVHRGADVRGFSFGAARILPRAALVDGEATTGALALIRRSDREPFSPAHAALWKR